MGNRLYNLGVGLKIPYYKKPAFSCKKAHCYLADSFLAGMPKKKIIYMHEYYYIDLVAFSNKIYSTYEFEKHFMMSPSVLKTWKVALCISCF